MFMPLLGVRGRAVLLVVIAAVPLALVAQRSFKDYHQNQFENLGRQAEQLARFAAARHAKGVKRAQGVLEAAVELRDELLGPECRRRG